jgi:enediyne biosynthesis protein E4
MADRMSRGSSIVPVVAALGLVAVAGAAGWALAAGGRTQAGGVEVPGFAEEAVAAGIEHAYRGGSRYFVGGGVAAFDCDDDGRPELYFAGGEDPAALFHNDSPVGGTLAFSRLSGPVTDVAEVTGAYPLDLDSDGVTDLAVLRDGENLLLRGLGECRFERANERFGFDGGDGRSTAFSATWEGDAALPTLAIGDYVTLDDTGTPVECPDNQLFRPEGDRYEAPVPLSPGYCPLSMLFSDWDRSGRRDLRVSNDRHYYGYSEDAAEQLWRMEPERPPRPYTADDGWQRLRIWGMGIASQDLTGDGYPEVFLTSQADNKLQTLADGPERPTYTDMALSRGVTATRPYAGDTSLPSTAWHAEFADVNNDGLADLFVAKGNVEAMPEFAARDPSNLLLGTPDGTFVEAAEAAGIVSFARARGGSLVDLNLDGLLELVVVNRQQNVLVWRNLGGGTADHPEPMGAWIALRLHQPGANPDAIGAWLEIRAGDRTIRRELTVGGGHVSGSLGWIHVGVGGEEQAEVTVTWPDGTREGPIAVDANTWSRLGRGSGRAEPWTP